MGAAGVGEGWRRRACGGRGGEGRVGRGRVRLGLGGHGGGASRGGLAKAQVRRHSARPMVPDPTPFPLDHLTLRGAPHAPALTVGGETLSYAALEEAVGRTADRLLSYGLVAGDRVA